MKEKIKVLPSQEIMGDILKAYVKINTILFPKRVAKDIVPGEFGILKARFQTLIEGALPEELNNFVSNFNNGEVSASDFECIIKGPIPQPQMNVVYYFEGILVEDRKYGMQYQIKQLHKVFGLDSLEQKEIFLRTILGDNKAQLLLDNFPDPTIPLEAKDIQALSAINGIGKLTAELLISKYHDNLEKTGEIIQLQEFGITPNMVSKMQEKFKSTDTIFYILKNNPYALIGTIEGIGWAKADAIALNGGYDPCGYNRICAYAQNYLREQAETSGHSWIYLDELVGAILGIAPIIDMDVLRGMLQEWTATNISDTTKGESKNWLYYEPETKKIGLMYYKKMEEQIADELLRLKYSFTKEYTSEEINSAIDACEAETGIPYTDEQREGICLCLQEGVGLLTGPSGSGKSTCMAPIVRLLNHYGKSFAQCSLSGKAASNLSEITGQDGFTIHRLLRVNPKTMQFIHNESCPLGYNTIILDELSLVGGEIFLSLLKAIPNGCRLICVGDAQQLPAIGLSNLIFDFIKSNVIPNKCLIKIHRQAARSGIISESRRISAGEQIIDQQPTVEIRGELQDLKLITYSDNVLSQETVLAEYKKLYIEQGISPRDIIIVTPLRSRGGVSALALNNEIQKIVNGIPRHNDVTLSMDGQRYVVREGDKILIGKNNYETVTVSGIEAPIYNGNVGIIKKIDDEKGEIIVQLTQQGDVVIPRKIWQTIELGYALTCHRAQGSQSPYCICVIDMSAYIMLSKEWLYTALTRARKFCVLVGQIAAVRKSISISKVIIRHTWLQNLLIEKEKGIIEHGIPEERNLENLHTYLQIPKEIRAVCSEAVISEMQSKVMS